MKSESTPASDCRHRISIDLYSDEYHPLGLWVFPGGLGLPRLRHARLQSDIFPYFCM